MPDGTLHGRQPALASSPKCVDTCDPLERIRLSALQRMDLRPVWNLSRVLKEDTMMTVITIEMPLKAGCDRPRHTLFSLGVSSTKAPQ